MKDFIAETIVKSIVMVFFIVVLKSVCFYFGFNYTDIAISFLLWFILSTKFAIIKISKDYK